MIVSQEIKYVIHVNIINYPVSSRNNYWALPIYHTLFSVFYITLTYNPYSDPIFICQMNKPEERQIIITPVWDHKGIANGRVRIQAQGAWP